MDAVRKGELGQCKTFRIIEVPEDIMPANCHFIAAHKSALVQADKLNELKIHTNPQGYSGPLIEARQPVRRICYRLSCQGRIRTRRQRQEAGVLGQNRISYRNDHR